VSGPTQLTVGQTGTWQISVRDASNRSSYFVVWGDEQNYAYGASTASLYAVTSTGSLSHNYLTPGTYTPRFTVTNSYGQSATASATVVVSGGCVYGYQYGYGCQMPPYPYPLYPYSY
jgi:PKD repeat protein